MDHPRLLAAATVRIVLLGLSVAVLARAPAVSADIGSVGQLPHPQRKHYIELAWQPSGGVYKMLRRAQQYTQQPGLDPIPVFLHGVDIEIFARSNYSRYRQIVDLARQLDAEGRIELRACRLALHRKFDRPNEIDSAIDLVAYVPSAIEELRREGYRPLSAAED